jgi:hypothetical protein
VYFCSGFDPSSGRAGFLIGKVASGQVFQNTSVPDLIPAQVVQDF